MYHHKTGTLRVQRTLEMDALIADLDNRRKPCVSANPLFLCVWVFRIPLGTDDASDQSLPLPPEGDLPGKKCFGIGAENCLFIGKGGGI